MNRRGPVCLALSLWLFAVGALAARTPRAAAKRLPWVYQADFRGGFSGWTSYPLVQDIGYDPTLTTQRRGSRFVLQRRIRAHGQRVLRLGLIRPLRFFAGAGSRIDLRYFLRTGGVPAHFSLQLAAASGKLFYKALPVTRGEHVIRISGAQLGLTASSRMQAIVLSDRLNSPHPGGVYALTLQQFTLHAQRRPRLRWLRPRLVHSTDQLAVARNVIELGKPLHLRLMPGAGLVHIRIYNDAAGRGHQRTLTLPSGTDQAHLSMGKHPQPGLWTALIRRGAARARFQFLVLPPRPQPHPRLLLSSARLEQLRRNKTYAALRAQIAARAQRLARAHVCPAFAGSNIAHMPQSSGLQPQFAGELVAYFQLLENCANTIAYNALDYRLAGRSRALVAASAALQVVSGWPTWTPPRFQHHGMHTYYEVGVFAQRVAFGYDLIADRLSQAEKRNVARALLRQLIRPTVNEYFLHDRMPTAGSNWMANSVGAAIEAAVAVEGDVPDWHNREGAELAPLLAAYQRALRGLFPGDGSEAEPAGYEEFAMTGLSWGLSALHALGIRPAGENRMLHGFWWPDYAMVNPGLVLDTGDFDGQLPSLSGFAWGAEHGNIPALRAFYDRVGNALDLSSHARLRHTGRKLEAQFGPLDLACCTRPAQPVPPPPPSRIFPLRGSAVLRSGWGPHATVISLRIGPWFNHEHHDEGSFQVAAFGQLLVGEAGYSDYYRDPHYVDYFSQAAGHNTVLLDGDPFSQTAYPGRYWKALAHVPHISRSLLTPAFDYLQLDLKRAYAGRLSFYRREFVFMKPDVLIVRDQLQAPRQHVFTWLLHAPPDAQLSLRGPRAVIQAPRAAALLTVAGPQTAWTERAMPISIHAFSSLSQQPIHVPQELLLTAPRARTASFLVGLRFFPGQADGNASQLQTIVAANSVGLQEPSATVAAEPEAMNSAVVFRTAAGLLRWGNYATDGTVLSVVRTPAGASWLAIGARRVERRGRVILQASVSLDTAWRRSQHGVAIACSAAHPATLRLALAAPGARQPPLRLRIDGRPETPRRQAGSLIIALSRGAHRVRILR